MSEIKMRRRSRQVSVTLTTSTASATRLYVEDFGRGGMWYAFGSERPGVAS